MSTPYLREKQRKTQKKAVSNRSKKPIVRQPPALYVYRVGKLEAENAEEQPASKSSDHGHRQAPDEQVAEQFRLVFVVAGAGDAKRAEGGQRRRVDQVGADVDRGN